jgi:hypothetical protein
MFPSVCVINSCSDCVANSEPTFRIMDRACGLHSSNCHRKVLPRGALVHIVVAFRSSQRFLCLATDHVHGLCEHFLAAAGALEWVLHGAGRCWPGCLEETRIDGCNRGSSPKTQWSVGSKCRRVVVSRCRYRIEVLAVTETTRSRLAWRCIRLFWCRLKLRSCRIKWLAFRVRRRELMRLRLHMLW